MISQHTEPEIKPVQWADEAKAFGFPTFPIRIERDPSGKWQKRPLTPNGHKDAHRDPKIFGSLWLSANGFGIPMGQTSLQAGLYALDLDFHRGDRAEIAAWIAKHHVPMETRQHDTVSGGIHLLYQLPSKHVTLPSRANIVPGLDSRGQGGWIAFGQGYTRIGTDDMLTLPSEACEAILAGYTGSGGGASVEVDVAAYEAPKGPAEVFLKAKIERAMRQNRTLLRRWTGTKPKGDTTRSALDHSVARLLAAHGFTTDEITYALLNVFENGACRDPKLTEFQRVRAALRSAVPAREAVLAEREAIHATPDKVSEGADEAFLAGLASNKTADPEGPAEAQVSNTGH